MVEFSIFSTNFLQFWTRFLRFLAEVRPNSSAERSVEMAELFGFGRTTFLAIRSFTTQKFDNFLFLQLG